MIQIIEDAIFNNYDCSIDEGWYVDCDSVLRELEEAGMLPPLTTRVIGKNFFGNDLKRNVYEWDGEDEA
jgi:hypothetical protein